MTEPNTVEEIPQAQTITELRSPWSAFLHWFWLPLGLLLLVTALWLYETHRDYEQITIRFQEGHGIKTGDMLRYLGTAIGKIVAVDLTPELDQLLVRIDLEQEARPLAREGSRFWIERPQLSIGQVTGLDTVVGDKYISMLPGPADAELTSEFIGLEKPPALSERTSLAITIHFERGHLLKVGDPLLYRDITLGEVTEINLTDDLKQVLVTLELTDIGQQVAREGSQFWIERPEVVFGEFKALETAFRGRHVGVSPGIVDAPFKTEFEGLAQRPLLIAPKVDGLRIVLEANRRGSLQSGSKMYFRGIEIGTVLDVKLSDDAGKIEANAYIDPEYKSLIRTNTRFWGRKGFQVDLDWSGIRLAMETVENLAVGGVNVGLPDPLGKPVTDGYRFRFYLEGESEWDGGEVSLPIGNQLLPEGLNFPTPLPASLEWQQRSYYLVSVEKRSHDALLLPLEGGLLLGPPSLLLPPEAEEKKGGVLKLLGKPYPFPAQVQKPDGRLAAYRLEQWPQDLPNWPLDRIREPIEKEDCFIINALRESTLAFSHERLELTKDGDWLLNISFPLDPSWDGASVISRRDGALIGILSVVDHKGRIILLEKEALGQHAVWLLLEKETPLIEEE